MLLILRVALALVQFVFIDSLVSFANSSGAHGYETDNAEV